MSADLERLAEEGGMIAATLETVKDNQGFFYFFAVLLALGAAASILESGIAWWHRVETCRAHRRRRERRAKRKAERRARANN